MADLDLTAPVPCGVCGAAVDWIESDGAWGGACPACSWGWDGLSERPTWEALPRLTAADSGAWVARLLSALKSVCEREAATDAWLTEVGHLSLLAAGVELTHLRERVEEMQYAYDCCSYADVEESLRVDELPAVAADVEALIAKGRGDG